jgi:hypothetical protein
VERFNDAFLAAKPHIQNPMFIECHRWRFQSAGNRCVGSVWILMINDIDIVLHTVNSPYNRSMPSGVAIVSDTPDIANAQ